MKMNKLNKVTMNKIKILSIALFASASVLQAQDIDEVKKQIDAEQFQKAKTGEEKNSIFDFYSKTNGI